MNLLDALTNLYMEWRRLTELEGQAITAGQWQEVDHQQTLKQQLKNDIVCAAMSWNEQQAAARADAGEYERRFRPVVDELIQMETRNHALLCAQRRRTLQELSELDSSHRNLRGLQRAYTSHGSGWWQSYS